MTKYSALLACLLVSVCSISFDAYAQQQDPSAKIAAAVLPLPEAMRSAATVINVDNAVETVLRKGSNGLVCKDFSTTQLFQANCFHETIIAINKRAAVLGKELNINGKALEDAVQKEIQSGKLKAPPVPSIGFQMRGPLSGYDAATHTVSKDVKVWQMVIIPYATGASLNLPEQPAGNSMPWVMNSGTWIAHIMVEH